MHAHAKRTNRAMVALLGALLLMSVFVRVSQPLLIEFKGDERAAIHLAKEYMKSNTIVGTSIRSSVGLPNPSFFPYSIVPAVFFSENPVWVTYYVMLLNVLGLLLLYRFARRAFGCDAALWATTLFASTPWSVVFSRKIWGPDLLFPFLMAAYALTFSMLTKYEPWKLFCTVVILTLATQLHLSAWPFFAIFVAFLFLSKLPVRRQDALVCMLVFFAIYSPYLLAVFANRDTSFATFLQHAPNRMSQPMLTNLGMALQTNTGLHFDYLLGTTGMTELRRLPFGPFIEPVFATYAYLCAVAFLAFCIGIGRKIFLEKKRLSTGEKLLSLMMTVFIGIQFAYVALHIRTFPHYQIVFYPLFPLLVAWMLPTVRSKYVSFGLQALLLLTIAANIVFMLSFYRVLSTKHETIRGDYGTPYLFQKK